MRTIVVPFLILIAVLEPMAGEDAQGETIGGQVEYNGKVGYFYKNGECTTATSAQCEVASGPLCSNNMCATTVGSCNEQGDGCLDLMGEVEECETPANLCGSGYCGTPPIYEDCRCENNECFSVVFKANNGSSTEAMNDEVVVITSENGGTENVSTLESSGFPVDTIGAQVTHNGEMGYFYKNGECTAATSAQCEVASGPLCANNMCATTTGSCSKQGDGCLDLMGEAEDCESPANVCGSGYCGAQL
ncbi:hypothetical protein HJC23_002841, partial [Cyclotella cryptica]